MPLMSSEQYLEIERKAEHRSEYFRGEMLAMAGPSIEHNLLVANVVRDIGQQLRRRQCEVYPSDMRIAVNATGLYTYPDAVIVCGDPQLADGHRDILLNPTVLVEVLSPSTEAYDRGRKFEHYRSIPSLREYLLISSDRMHVDQYTLQAPGRWILASFDKPEAVLELPSVGCTLTLADLYEKVEL
jgi:Uma2 family endonuclease